MLNLLRDILIVLLIVSQLLLFGAGMAPILRRLGLVNAVAGICGGSALSLLLLIFVTTLLEISGIPALYPGAAVVACVQANGVLTVIRRWSKVGGMFAANGGPLSGIGVLLFVTAAFWLWTMRDLAGLSSFQDGIAHTAYVVAFLNSGHALLTTTPAALSDIFGSYPLRFYPSGTHALVAMFGVPVIKTGLVFTADYLKAFTVVVALALPFLVFVVISRIGGRHKIPALIAAVAISFDSRFPVWAIDSGGMSRLLAYALVFAIIWDLLLDGRRINVAVWLAVLPATFLCHPTAAATLAIALVSQALAQKFRSSRIDWSVFVGLVAGGLLVLMLLKVTGATDATIRQADATLIDQAHFRGDFVELYKVFLFDTAASRFGPLSITDLLLLLTIGSVFVPRGRAVWRAYPPEFLLYPVVAFAGLEVFAATSFIPGRVATLIGNVFYHDRQRITESFFAAKAVLAGAGAVMFWGWFTAPSRREHRWWPAVASALVLLVVANKAKSATAAYAHLREKFAEYKSPSHRESDDLIEFVRSATEIDSLFIYEPLLIDSLEARTGRRGFFMDEECPNINDNPNCRARLALNDEVQTALARAAGGQTTPVTTCLPFLQRLSHPIYIVVDAATWAARLPRLAICQDLRVVEKFDRFYLFRYMASKPA